MYHCKISQEQMFFSAINWGLSKRQTIKKAVHIEVDMKTIFLLAILYFVPEKFVLE